MKCFKCGFEFGEEYAYCPNCGAIAQVKDPSLEDTLPKAVPISLNPTQDMVLKVLRSGLFLAICILLTLSTFFSLISGSLPIINILLSVFCWITYYRARFGEADSGMIRSVSGTVYAHYIIGNVAYSILIVCGLIISLLLFLPMDTAALVNAFEASGAFSQFDFFSEITESTIAIIIKSLGPIIVAISLIGLLINIFGMRKIHRFVKSVYFAIDTQSFNFEYVTAAKNWLIFYAVIQAIASINSFGENIIAGMAAISLVVVHILAVLLIRRYFEPIYDADIIAKVLAEYEANSENE